MIVEQVCFDNGNYGRKRKGFRHGASVVDNRFDDISWLDNIASQVGLNINNKSIQD